MTLPEIALIAVALAMDCFAVAIGVCSCQRQSWATILKMAFFFGLFQALMPVIGWLIGESLRDLIEAVDHWIAFGLLAFIGGRMIWNSLKKKEKQIIHHLTLFLLLMLSVATSIDALITGIGFGLIHVNILEAAIVIFITTFAITVFGAKIGQQTSFISAQWAERLGGFVLILIGIKVLVEHLLS